MFARMMIPHHEQAVEMSTLAETRAQDPQIKALAAQIKAAQQPEIDLMKSWLDEAGHMGGDMGHGMGDMAMPGILTDRQMAELKAASGQKFDLLYAQYMIEHHKGAIEMARDVEDSANPAVAELARGIIAAQEKEIAQMQAFVDTFG